MLQRILTVALNAYREAVRARVLLGLAGVAFSVALYSLVVGAFTLNDAPRVVADLGTAAVSVFSIAVAVLIAATALHRELEMKTILPLLARPIGRSEYLVGKFAGVMLVVCVFVMAEAGLVLMMCAVMGGRSPVVVGGLGVGLAVVLGLAAWRLPSARTFGPIPWSVAMFLCGFFLCSVSPPNRSLVVASSMLTILEVMVVASIATLYSSFSTPFLSALLTLGMFIVGRSADSMADLPVRYFGETMSEGGKLLAKVIPNLHIYVPARPLLTGESVASNLPVYVGEAALMSLGWTVGLLTAASLIFQRRDFV